MEFFILTAIATVALAAEIYPDTTYKSAPTYLQPAYKSYEKNYEYAPRPYSFDYAVKDDYSYVDFNHNEYSDGKTVSGTYRVVLPDSRVQTVTYKDEGYGLIADVKYEGTAQYSEYKPAYKPNYPPNYQQDKPAYTPSKPVYEQPQVAYEQPKTVYTTPKYPVQPAQRPVYNTAPGTYNSPQAAYTPSPVIKKPAPVDYSAEVPAYKVSPVPAAYKPAAVEYKAEAPVRKPNSAAYNPSPVTYNQTPTVY